MVRTFLRWAWFGFIAVSLYLCNAEVSSKIPPGSEELAMPSVNASLECPPGCAWGNSSSEIGSGESIECPPECLLANATEGMDFSNISKSPTDHSQTTAPTVTDYVDDPSCEPRNISIQDCLTNWCHPCYSPKYSSSVQNCEYISHGYPCFSRKASDPVEGCRQMLERSHEERSDKAILDTLLCKDRYDKRIAPSHVTCKPENGTSTSKTEKCESNAKMTVVISVLLLSLASPDESSLKYEVEFLLEQTWGDPRLEHKYGADTNFSYLNAIHHYEDVWLPDTYFIMHGDFKDPLIPVHFALRIFRNGTVVYVMRRHLILSCQGMISVFPFDDPECSFSMESISYESSVMEYVWKSKDGTLKTSPSLSTLNAYLIRNQTTNCEKPSWRGNYSCLQVDLIFTRDRSFYFTTVFIPGIILVTSSFITFWLEWNAVPARVMIGVTTMLNFFTTSNGFRSTLPVVSNLTAMNVWDGVCMCFIYASLLEFVCVNYVGRKRPLHNVVYRPGENPVTQGDRKRDVTGPNEIVTCTNCGPNPCTHSANNGCATEVRKKEPPHPIRVAKTIDVIARIIFPTAYAIFLIFFFVHYRAFS